MLVSYRSSSYLPSMVHLINLFERSPFYSIYHSRITSTAWLSAVSRRKKRRVSLTVSTSETWACLEANLTRVPLCANIHTHVRVRGQMRRNCSLNCAPDTKAGIPAEAPRSKTSRNMVFVSFVEKTVVLPVQSVMPRIVHKVSTLFNIFLSVSFKHLGFNNVRVCTVSKLSRWGRSYIYSKLDHRAF